MRYAIDASSANKPNKTGVEWYAFHLLHALMAEPLQEGEEVELWTPNGLTDDWGELPSGWIDRPLVWPFKRAWMAKRVNWELLRNPPDVFFVPGQTIPFFSPHTKGKRTVTTIHDIGYARAPQVFDPRFRRAVRFATKRALKRANQIISVSEFTKQELIDVHHADPSRIFVTPLSANTHVYHEISQAEKARVQQLYRLSPQFFVTVGRLETRKNTTLTIRAFEQFKSTRGAGDPYELILIGNPGFGYHPEIKAFLDHSPYASSIKTLGYVPETDTAPILSQAKALLFPSVYEGFGIPILEAMAAGCPVLASDIPPSHEVASTAATFLPVNNPATWATHMQHLAENEPTRQTLIKAGLDRAQHFSWQKTAEATWNVLRGK